MIKIRYEINCEQCKKIVVTKLIFQGNEKTVTKRDGRVIDLGDWSCWSDVFGPAIPSGWIQQVKNEKKTLFFCNKDCCCKWIRKNEGEDAAEEFKTGIWTA